MSDGHSPRGNFPGGRKREIEQYLEQVGHATVAALAERFAVSADTVRRDLEELQSEGVVRRSHGGATSTRYQSGKDFPLRQRLQVNDERKARIGALGAGLISDGMTVLVNGGSTVLAALPHLGARTGLTVVTNNLLVPSTIPEEALRALYLVGGAVRMISQVTIGPLLFPSNESGSSAHRIAGDVALIAVGGVSVEGYTTSDLGEARMMREFMEAANRVVVLADSTKIGARRFAEIAPLRAADTLITDDEVPVELAAALAEADVEVLVAAGGTQ